MNITVPIGIFLIALPVLAIAGPPNSKPATTKLSAETQVIVVDTLAGFPGNPSEAFGQVMTLESDDSQLHNVSDEFSIPVEDPAVSDAYGVVQPLS